YMAVYEGDQSVHRPLGKVAQVHIRFAQEERSLPDQRVAVELALFGILVLDQHAAVLLRVVALAPHRGEYEAHPILVWVKIARVAETEPRPIAAPAGNAYDFVGHQL